MKNIDLPLTELLAGLAEECAELAQAALKLRRKFDGTNPTPISEDDAIDHFEEEVADVELYLEQIDYSRQHVTDIKTIKMNRWNERLKEARLIREEELL